MGAVARAVLAAAVVGVVGCTSVVEGVVGVTGTRLGLGEHAAVPEGFPIELPADAALVSSVRMELGGFETTTVSLAFPADPGDLLVHYVQVMQAHGMNVTSVPRGSSASVTGVAEDGERWTAELNRGKDYSKLILSVTHAQGPPPSDPTP